MRRITAGKAQATMQRRLGGAGLAGRLWVTLGVLAGTLVGAPGDSVLGRGSGRGGRRDVGQGGERGRGRRRRRQRGRRGAEPLPPEDFSWSTNYFKLYRFLKSRI